MKYRLTDETKIVDGHTLHRIECVKSFSDVKVGAKGGWIEKEENLSQFDNCWVYDNACVYDNAKIYDDARVFRYTRIYDNVCVYGDAKIYIAQRIVGDKKVWWIN